MLSAKPAVEAFISGWVYSRRMEREISRVPLDTITLLRFGGGSSATYELMVHDTPPVEVVHQIRQYIPGQSHTLSVFAGDSAIDGYTRRGYSFVAREYLMARDLKPGDFTATDSAFTVQQVMSEADRQMFNLAHTHEVIPARALTDTRIRYYFIQSQDTLICEGRCILIDDRIAVIDSVRTHSEYRRRGLASNLMRTLLRDAIQRGAQSSVLVASDDGHKLYLTLDYEVLTDLLIFEK